MHSERDTRDDVSRSHGLLDGFQGFGSRRSMFPSLFGGRDPFGDPFFSGPIGSIFESSMFSPSSVSSDTPGSGRANKISVSGKEPSIEHPDDVVDVGCKMLMVAMLNLAERKGKDVTVTCGDVDGAYYTSTRTRRAGGDGVALEETKEADKTTGQATHRVSRGLHDKGHSVTRKLTSDGRVDVLQTLHNLNEDELPGFEVAWNGNVEGHLPSWKHEFDMHGT
ncbi:hypothetical protein C1H46_011025 [Malus baccata]|uniref:Uncharacterized protein n=1 Tax=Malus baccata TaxID=106549 RepID=A0A540MX63_MALBA|nr:hypothetical protein C1H46_011025 [Malus baccata]